MPRTTRRRFVPAKPASLVSHAWLKSDGREVITLHLRGCAGQRIDAPKGRGADVLGELGFVEDAAVGGGE